MPKPIMPTIPTRRARPHVAAACAAATFAVALVGALVLLFDDASRLPWFAPTIDHAGRVAACHAASRAVALGARVARGHAARNGLRAQRRVDAAATSAVPRL